MRDFDMAKDPAFLFYSKDWLEGTAELLPHEKGIFIDLLCHQHQKGDLPTDTIRLARIVGLSHEEFLSAWEEVGKKFESIDNRLVNRKLTEVLTERFDRGKKNRIIGTFAGLLRKQNLPFNKAKKVKESFNPTDFMEFDSELMTERLTEWFMKRLKSIEDEDEDINKDSKGVKGERKDESIIDYTTGDLLYLSDKDFQDQYSMWRIMLRSHHNIIPNKIDHDITIQKLKGYSKQEALDCLADAIQGRYKTLHPQKAKDQNGNSFKQPTPTVLKGTIHTGFKSLNQNN